MSLWNGHRAAVSLTFDDGLIVQREHALPVMNARGVRGTFFVISKTLYVPIEFWKEQQRLGHEIGSHSENHKKLADMDEKEVEHEVRASKFWLERELDAKVTSFCYPYTDVNGIILPHVKHYYDQARGGRVARKDKFMIPGDGANLWNTPALHIGPSFMHNKELPEMVETAVRRGAWLVLMLHGVGPDESQWDNIFTEQFEELLNAICIPEIWVAPFGEVAGNFRRYDK